jgi:hypothetical protein
MGRPRHPTRQQLKLLRQATTLPAPELHTLVNGSLSLTLSPNSLLLLEISP